MTPNISVLVVDDYDDAAESLASVLELHGFQATALTDGKEALAFCAATPPDVLFLDLMMPRIDGWEVARRVQDLPTAKPPLIVAITGCNNPEAQSRAKEAGVSLVLLKPVEPAVLLGILNRFQRGLSVVDLADGERTEEPEAAKEEKLSQRKTAVMKFPVRRRAN